MKRIISGIILLCMLAALPAFAYAESIDTQKIVEQLVVSYGTYGEEAEPVIDGLLQELRSADPDAAEKWESILALWKEANTDLSVNPGVLPDGRQAGHGAQEVHSGQRGLDERGIKRSSRVGRGGGRARREGVLRQRRARGRRESPQRIARKGARGRRGEQREQHKKDDESARTGHGKPLMRIIWKNSGKRSGFSSLKLRIPRIVRKFLQKKAFHL